MDPLIRAARDGDADKVRRLLQQGKYSVNCKDTVFKSTPLHYACEYGHLAVVRVLVSEFKADLTIRDRNNLTALMLASRGGHEDVVLALLREYHCPVTCRDRDGWGVLHHACAGGSVRVVHTLIRDHNADVNAHANKNNTPLHVAADVKEGKCEVALSLINDFGCDPNALDYNGKTVLHYACSGGSIELVHTLIREHNADVNRRDGDNNTPLHAAAARGRLDIVQSLINDYSCDPNARGYKGRTPLHQAAQFYRASSVVEMLLKYTSPVVADDDGNTPLHLASQWNSRDCMKALVRANAPLLIRNSRGETPVDVASYRCKPFLSQYIKENRSQLQVTVLEHAKKRYSGSHRITRVFVLGYPGAGKSSFVEALKREGFFQSFQKVSESSVPPHTAGIIPSTHMSKQYGRVLFYDFAGDAEYYSSHAAIFESLASSRKGDNIFIVVVDLRGDSATIETTLHYWSSFIQYQKFKQPTLLVVGSHLDLSTADSKKGQDLSKFCAAVQSKVHHVKHFMLDCRDPRSNQIAELKKQILAWVSESREHKISNEATVLLGLLEKDFSAVSACPVQTVLEHVKEYGMLLPSEAEALYPILFELHEVGVVLLVGDCAKGEGRIILNASKLTNDVHKLLFSESAFCETLVAHPELVASLKTGILPHNILSKILPPHITIECLVHLQYCQQIRHNEIGIFQEQTDSTDQSFLFFPALCSVDKSQVVWVEPTGNSFSIGWLALCTDPHDYFPPRFLHVLLLRLVYTFTLSAPAQLQTAHASPVHGRRCTMWKTGVQWCMEEGVDCMVELVSGSQGVVVFIKTCKDRAENCTSVFAKIVSCVMEAKAEFCRSVKPQFFLIDSSAESVYLNEDHQFALSDVERALKGPEGKEVIVSVSGKGKLELSKVQCMRKLTLWDSLFPIDVNAVLHILRDIVKGLYDLGENLGAPRGVLEALEADFPFDVKRRKRELVRWWMSSSTVPPCWWHLVSALKKMGENVLAQEITKVHGADIQLQEKLLGQETQALKPDEEFLRSLSGVVGSRWPSLAVSLSLSEGEIEGLKGKVGFSQKEIAFQMLRAWVSREGATYGQLCRQIKTITLFTT